MSTLFDIFGFLSVVLHGLELVAQSVLLGSVAFMALAIAPAVGSEARRDVAAICAGSRRIVAASALAAIACVGAATAINAAILAASLPGSWTDVAGARFVVAGAVKVLAAATIAMVVWARIANGPTKRLVLGAAGTLFLAAALADSHASARLQDNAVLLFATGAHEVGAALWLGALPCFWLVLQRAGTGELAGRIGRRFSALAVAGVALIMVGAVVFAALYVGSFGAVYGTAYGAMAATKGALLSLLLLLGLANFRAVRRFAGDADAIRQVQRFVEVEMGIGLAALMAAASITSMPPAVDLSEDRVTYSEFVDRFRPALPRLVSPDPKSLAIPELQARLDAEWEAGVASTRVRAFEPGDGSLPPRNAQDIAWSEYNHHWAGVLVALMGLAALAQRSRHVPWAKHWPLLFLLLSGLLLLRADPEVWPLGEVGVIESLKSPEVLQHRLFVLLIVAFALFEWGVRTGRITARNLQRVFPLLTALGGILLLTHSHALGNVKQEVLVDLAHLPIAVLGVGAGWARWLEVEAPQDEGRWAGWVWPICFVLIGLLLLGYREA